MITRVMRLIGATLALCGGLVGIVYVLAQTQDPPPYVAAFLPDSDPGCPVPCWQGLRPGYIDQDTLDTWIANPPDGWGVAPTSTNTRSEASTARQIIWRIRPPDGPQFSAFMNHLNEPTAEEIFLSPSDLRLGDLMGALGEPRWVAFTGHIPPVHVNLYYPDHQLIVSCYLGQFSAPALLPSFPVYWLDYHALPLDRLTTALDWNGFGPLMRYYPQMYPPYMYETGP